MRVCKSTHTLTDIRYRDNETDGCPSVATQAALRALQAQNKPETQFIQSFQDPANEIGPAILVLTDALFRRPLYPLGGCVGMLLAWLGPESVTLFYRCISR